MYLQVNKVNMLYHHKRNNQNYRKVEVYVYWGLGGTGKTRKVFDENPNVFRCNNWKAFNGLIFDGYDGEDVILLDDFCGNIPFNFFLNIIDGHPLSVKVKYGHVSVNYTKVFITSTKIPTLWYPSHQTNTDDYMNIFTEITELK
jgi:hypothetical protein